VGKALTCLHFGISEQGVGLGFFLPQQALTHRVFLPPLDFSRPTVLLSVFHSQRQGDKCADLFSDFHS
jgi:hypothetical protein